MMRTKSGARAHRRRRGDHWAAMRQLRSNRLRRGLRFMDDRVALERLQRDFEQAAADVAQRIRELDEPTEPQSADRRR